MLRVCTFCREEKELIAENFARYKTGFQWTCRPCQKVYRKRHAELNKKLQADQKRERKQKIKDFLADVRSQSACVQCGENHPAVLDFHHRDPSTKVAGVSVMLQSGWSIERIKLELDKCDVLCSNCHRKLHWSDRN